MTLWSRLRSWVQAMLRRSRMESEMDAELRFHVEAYTEDLARGGVPRQEAMRRARIEFGGIERAKEECREARGVNILESLIQDVRYGLRTLQKNLGFTVVAVVTLALGIGANAAIFGLVDSAFLRGLPFRDPERLVHVWTIEADHDQHTPTPAQYQAVRDSSKSFEQVAAEGWADYFYSADGSLSEDLAGSLVTPNWLSTLGVHPLLGRNFREEEQIAGRDAVVMLSYGVLAHSIPCGFRHCGETDCSESSPRNHHGRPASGSGTTQRTGNICSLGPWLLRKRRKRQSRKNEGPDHCALEAGRNSRTSAFRSRNHR